jgi:hypothetical protein
MITLNADLLRQGIEEVRKKGIEAKAAALAGYRSKILAAFRELLLISPQYSGNLVSNWDIQVEGMASRPYRMIGSKDPVTEAFIGTPHHAGDESEEFNSAYARGVQRMRYITYFGQPVYFVNPILLEIDSPLILGPDGTEEMRDSIAIFAWASISSYLQERYGS